MDRIQTLRIFVRLVETLSFSQTAASLEIARSTVSKVVTELERDLDAKLFRRTTRSVVLTPNGAAFYRRCQSVLREIDAMDGMFAAEKLHARGKLRVNVPSRIARRIIAPNLPDFLLHHPQIDLDLAATDRAVDLVGEGFDCAIRVGEQKDSGLVSKKLADLEMINCASPAYLETFGIPASLEDLSRHRAIGYASSRVRRDHGWEYIDNGRTRMIRMPTALRVNNAELYLACCVAGLGLIQIPAFDVRELMAKGALVEVLPDHPCAPMPLAIVSPERPSQVPTVRAFADWAERVIRTTV